MLHVIRLPGYKFDFIYLTTWLNKITISEFVKGVEQWINVLWQRTVTGTKAVYLSAGEHGVVALLLD